jgi:hypothetical protein
VAKPRSIISDEEGRRPERTGLLLSAACDAGKTARLRALRLACDPADQNTPPAKQTERFYTDLGE